MVNKLSKKECLRLLKEEKFSRKTVSFYRYVYIDLPEDIRDRLYAEWSKINILGRVYLANEGINAQISVPKNNWDFFTDNLASYKYFKDIPLKLALEDEIYSFIKLTIKVRRQIVADGLLDNQYDVTNIGHHLSALEWNNAINNGGVIVDMRNHYESEIGRFKNAICPDSETFSEELPMVKALLKGKENKQILLYCTGGIRCEKTSAYLRHYGFKDVSQLHGGIIDYVRQIKSDKNLENKFIGKNFVFDDRRAESVTTDVISKCHQCNSSCDTHVNCKNENCNLLFLQCSICSKKNQNCCSRDCIDTINLPEKERSRLRKGISNKKIFHSHKKVQLDI